MAGRPPSFDSISTASDATLDSWSLETAEQLEPGLEDEDAIPLHTFGEGGTTLQRLRASGRRAFRQNFPQDTESLLVFFGVIALLLMSVALLPWLAGESKGPRRAPSPPSNASTPVLSSRPPVSSVVASALSQAVSSS